MSTCGAVSKFSYHWSLSKTAASSKVIIERVGRVLRHEKGSRTATVQALNETVWGVTLLLHRRAASEVVVVVVASNKLGHVCVMLETWRYQFHLLDFLFLELNHSFGFCNLRRWLEATGMSANNHIALAREAWRAWLAWVMCHVAGLMFFNLSLWAELQRLIALIGLLAVAVTVTWSVTLAVTVTLTVTVAVSMSMSVAMTLRWSAEMDVWLQLENRWVVASLLVDLSNSGLIDRNI